MSQAAVSLADSRRQVNMFLVHLLTCTGRALGVDPTLPRPTKTTLRKSLIESTKHLKTKQPMDDIYERVISDSLLWMDEYESELKGLSCYRFTFGDAAWRKKEKRTDRRGKYIFRLLKLTKQRGVIGPLKLRWLLSSNGLPENKDRLILKKLRGDTNRLKAYFHLARLKLLEIAGLPSFQENPRRAYGKENKKKKKRPHSVGTEGSSAKRARIAPKLRKDVRFCFGDTRGMTWEEVCELAQMQQETGGLCLLLQTRYLTTKPDFKYSLSFGAFKTLFELVGEDKTAFVESASAGAEIKVFKAVEGGIPDMTKEDISGIKMEIRPRSNGFRLNFREMKFCLGLESCVSEEEKQKRKLLRSFSLMGVLDKEPFQNTLASAISSERLRNSILKSVRSVDLVYLVGMCAFGWSRCIEKNLTCLPIVAPREEKPHPFLCTEAKELISLHLVPNPNYNPSERDKKEYIRCIMMELEGWCKKKTLIQNLFSTNLTPYEAWSGNGAEFVRFTAEMNDTMTSKTFPFPTDDCEQRIQAAFERSFDGKEDNQRVRSVVEEAIGHFKTLPIHLFGISCLPKWFNPAIQYFCASLQNASPMWNINLVGLLNVPTHSILYPLVDVTLDGMISEIREKFIAGMRLDDHDVQVDIMTLH